MGGSGVWVQHYTDIPAPSVGGRPRCSAAVKSDQAMDARAELHPNRAYLITGLDTGYFSRLDLEVRKTNRGANRADSGMITIWLTRL